MKSIRILTSCFLAAFASVALVRAEATAEKKEAPKGCCSVEKKAEKKDDKAACCAEKSACCVSDKKVEKKAE